MPAPGSRSVPPHAARTARAPGWRRTWRACRRRRSSSSRWRWKAAASLREDTLLLGACEGRRLGERVVQFHDGERLEEHGGTRRRKRRGRVPGSSSARRRGPECSSGRGARVKGPRALECARRTCSTAATIAARWRSRAARAWASAGEALSRTSPAGPRRSSQKASSASSWGSAERDGRQIGAHADGRQRRAHLDDAAHERDEAREVRARPRAR